MCIEDLHQFWCRSMFSYTVMGYPNIGVSDYWDIRIFKSNNEMHTYPFQILLCSTLVSFGIKILKSAWFKGLYAVNMGQDCLNICYLLLCENVNFDNNLSIDNDLIFTLDTSNGVLKHCLDAWSQVLSRQISLKVQRYIFRIYHIQSNFLSIPLNRSSFYMLVLHHFQIAIIRAYAQRQRN